MKVEEAKTKVCPFIVGVRFAWEEPGDAINIKCIVGDCIAWVWDENGAHTTNENGTIFHEGYCARIGQ